MEKAQEILSHSTQVELIDTLCSKFIVTEGTVSFHSVKRAELLQFLILNQYISFALVNSAVQARLLALGEAMYREHLERRTYPDHLGCACVFGFFLDRNRNLIPSVHFDHGETAEEYLMLAKGLQRKILEQLLAYKELKFSFPVPVLDCCC